MRSGRSGSEIENKDGVDGRDRRVNRIKFWLESPLELFSSLNIVPNEDERLEAQMNSLTRLVLIVFIILFLLDYKNSILFLLLSILFIIILYYIQRTRMKERFRRERHERPLSYVRENYGLEKGGKTYLRGLEQGARGLSASRYHRFADHSLSNIERGNPMLDNPTSGRFCNDSVPIAVNALNTGTRADLSMNQRLVGPANPKTRIAPVVVAPAADLSYWKANNMVTHSAVNEETNRDIAQSGYQITSCCSPGQPRLDCRPRCVKEEMRKDNGGSGGVHGGVYDLKTRTRPSREAREGRSGNLVKAMRKDGGDLREGFEYPYIKSSGDGSKDSDLIPVAPARRGQVNTACGYNPEQLFSAGLPTNYPAGNCQKNPAMKAYNDSLFTQTIQPGVYTRNQINEPINANIGISFDQQFEPLTREEDKDGNIFYTEHDPRIMEPIPVKEDKSVTESINMSNVYDPRHSGYGTSYRSYTEPVTGQTRFYYDDVNSIRMPNYITRSNIDFAPFADKYGPIPCDEDRGNSNHSGIRMLANNAFTNATIEQRTELQERLMRKANARSWQRRQAPISTNGQFMAGSMRGAYPII